MEYNLLENWEFLITEIWGLMAASALVTGIICWFAWGSSAARANIGKLNKANEELDMARSLLTQSRADVQRSERKQEELKNRLARERSKNR